MMLHGVNQSYSMCDKACLIQLPDEAETNGTLRYGGKTATLSTNPPRRFHIKTCPSYRESSNQSVPSLQGIFISKRALPTYFLESFYFVDYLIL